MDRSAMARLVAWKDAPERKPLAVNGARQIGKTRLVTEFDRQRFDATAPSSSSRTNRQRASSPGASSRRPSSG